MVSRTLRAQLYYKAMNSRTLPANHLYRTTTPCAIYPTNIKQNHKLDRRQNSDPPLSQYASLLVIKVMHDAY